MPVGSKYKELGFAFNESIITDVLRKNLGFTGIVFTDWAYSPWTRYASPSMGCENLGELERVVTILDAGCHQFGGESPPEMVVQAVQDGSVTEDRIDESIRRMLQEKFALGLFDDKRFVENFGSDADAFLHKCFGIGDALLAWSYP